MDYPTEEQRRAFEKLLADMRRDDERLYRSMPDDPEPPPPAAPRSPGDDRPEVVEATNVLVPGLPSREYFDCERCGRWASMVDAARERSISISLLGVSQDDWHRIEHAAFRSPVRPGWLERELHQSYEAAVGILATAIRVGLLEARSKGGAGSDKSTIFLCATCLIELRETQPLPSAKVRPAVPPQLRFRVMQRDAFRCRYCGRSSREAAVLHIDHVVPVAAGGETTEDNLITACAECNLGKSDDPV